MPLSTLDMARYEFLAYDNHGNPRYMGNFYTNGIPRRSLLMQERILRSVGKRRLNKRLGFPEIWPKEIHQN